MYRYTNILVIVYATIDYNIYTTLVLTKYMKE